MRSWLFSPNKKLKIIVTKQKINHEFWIPIPFSNYEFLNSYIFESRNEEINLDLDELLDLIYKNLPFETYTVKLEFNYNEQDKLNYFISKYDLDKVEYTEDGSIVEATIDEYDHKKYKDNIMEKEYV